MALLVRLVLVLPVDIQQDEPGIFARLSCLGDQATVAQIPYSDSDVPSDQARGSSS